MTIARQRKPQPIVHGSERENLFSVVPGEDDVTNSGENNAAEQEVQQENPQELDGAIVSELHGLESWLHFKVKNELIRQFYVSDEYEDDDTEKLHPLSEAERVKKIIKKELIFEKDKNLNQALRLNDLIPEASTREKSARGVHGYSVEDLENLQRRIDVHREVVIYIKAIETTGEDGLDDVTNKYILHAQPDALKEIMATVAQQKNELDSRNALNKGKISELEGIIEVLRAEMQSAKEQLEGSEAQLADRDMQLLNNEFVDHLAHVDDLTKAAQQLAR